MLLRNLKTRRRRSSVLGGLWLLWCLGLSLSLLLPTSLAQRCSGAYSAKNNHTDPGIPTECLPFVASSPFFIPPEDLNLTRSDILLESAIQARSLSPVKDSCRIPAVRFACASYYQPCTLHPISDSLPNFFVFPLPKSPCRFLCLEMVEACRDVLPSSSLPDCEAIYNYTTYEVNGLTYNVSCNYEADSQVVGETTECPEPLILTDGKGVPPCQPRCTYMAKDEIDVVWILMYICSSISVVCAGWLIICWLSQEKLRKFPANLPLFPATGSFLASLTIVVSAIIGHESIVCENAWTRGSTHGLCGVQGFFMLLGYHLNGFYFFIICLNLFILLVLEVRLEMYRWYPTAVYTIGTGMSLALSIAPYAAQKFDSTAEGHCFISVLHLFWLWMFFYSWIVFFLACNAVMFPIILIKLRLIKYRTGKTWKVSGMITFLFIFTAVYVVAVAYGSYVTANIDSWFEGIEEQALCNARFGKNCPNWVGRNFEFGAFQFVVIALVGFWNLLSFAPRWSVHCGGLLFLKAIFIQRRWKVIATGLTAADTESSGSSKSGSRKKSSTPSR